MTDNADRAQAVNDRAMHHYLKRPRVAESPRRWIGICVICEECIEPERLKIMPYATRCVECQQDYEDGLRRV